MQCTLPFSRERSLKTFVLIRQLGTTSKNTVSFDIDFQNRSEDLAAKLKIRIKAILYLEAQFYSYFPTMSNKTSKHFSTKVYVTHTHVCKTFPYNLVKQKIYGHSIHTTQFYLHALHCSFISYSIARFVLSAR